MSVKAQRTQEINSQQKNEKIKEAASPTTPKIPTSLKKGSGQTKMVHSAGVEPTTSTSGGWRSIQLSYECTQFDNIFHFSDFSTPFFNFFQKKKKKQDFS